MSSEKPFWKGKTCGELEGLRVKITWNNGDTMTSTLDMVGNVAHCVSLSPAIRSSSTFVPYSGIKSIELVDDPEYERIDNIENVQVGDIACTTEGNHFPVIDLKPDPLGDMLLRIRISEIDGEYCIDSDDFATLCVGSRSCPTMTGCVGIRTMPCGASPSPAWTIRSWSLCLSVTRNPPSPGLFGRASTAST